MYNLILLPSFSTLYIFGFEHFACQLPARSCCSSFTSPDFSFFLLNVFCWSQGSICLPWLCEAVVRALRSPWVLVCSYGKSSGKGKQNLGRQEVFVNLRTAARGTGWLCWSWGLWKQQAHLLPSCVFGAVTQGMPSFPVGKQLCISPPIWTLQADSALQMFPLCGRKWLCILHSVKLEICSWQFLTFCNGTCIYHRGVAGLIFFNTRVEK